MANFPPQLFVRGRFAGATLSVLDRLHLIPIPIWVYRRAPILPIAPRRSQLLSGSNRLPVVAAVASSAWIRSASWNAGNPTRAYFGHRGPPLAKLRAWILRNATATKSTTVELAAA